ncbi:MAG TPA: histidine phosphatase family protein, partial [Nitrosomonas sp.]|nr:histidine phosphatase family protein [Nitrosomonas sp.]
AQARTLASALDLQPGQIVISEFLRTHETAQPFSTKVSMQPIIHSGLNEFSCLDPNLIEGNLEWQLAVYRSLDRTAQNGEEGETE